MKRQLEEDQRIDQLSLIEYTDPFTGEPVEKGKIKQQPEKVERLSGLHALASACWF